MIIDIQLLKYDLKPGKEFFAVLLYTFKSFDKDGNYILNIDGTFCHYQCEGSFCSKCASIPFMPDFRKRVICGHQTLEKRGERILKPGCMLDYLQHQELLECAREWQKRCYAWSLEVYTLNHALITSTKSKLYLETKLRNVLREQSLPEVAEYFKEHMRWGLSMTNLCY